MNTYRNGNRVDVVFLRTAAAGALAAALVTVPRLCPAAAEESRPEDTQSVTLEEVVVTAQKRAEPLQEVPGAVTAMTAERLQVESANGLEDYFREVPSLSLISGSQGTEQLSIRGVNSSQFTGPTVGIYIDDTPIGTTVAGDHANQLVPDLDPSDLERIEVLRGPQGTLYGAANMGGLLKFVTARPSLVDYSGRVEVGGSDTYNGGGGYTARGAFTGPVVSDTLGLRISAYERQDPGFITDPGVVQNPLTNQSLSQPRNTDINAARVFGGRASALWSVIPDLTLQLSAIYQGRRGDGQTAEDINGLTQQPLHGDLAQIASRFTGQSSARLEVYNAALNWDLHGATLLSSTSYAVNNYRSVTDITGLVPPSPSSGFPPGPPAPPFLFPNAGAGYFTYPALPESYYTPVSLTYRTGKVTEELRLTSAAQQLLEWQLGFFYTHEGTTGTQEIDLDNPASGAAYTPTGVCLPPVAAQPPFPPIPACGYEHVPAPPGTALHHSFAETAYTEYSEYADLTYHVTSGLSVEGGVRFSKYRESFSQAYDGIIDFLSNQVFSGSSSSPTKDASKVTYLASLKYQLTHDLMLYGRFATGYRPGGANSESPGAGASFGPDSTNNYEIGVKATLADGRLILSADGYLIDWSNIQIQTTTPLGFVYFVNGRTARSEGFELEATVAPVAGLRVRANAAYNHAVLRENIPTAIGVYGLEADRLPYSPEWSAALSADYTFPVSAAWRGNLGVDYQYVDAVFGDFNSCTSNSGDGCATSASLPPGRVELAPYSVVNLRTGLNHELWSVTLYVKNAFDRRAFISESIQHATFAQTVPNGRAVPDSATMILPRTVGLSLVRSF